MPFGIFGKLPQKRDFIAHNLPRGVLEPFETWLQSAVAASRAELAWRLRALAGELPACRVAPTSERGVAVEHVEALAFAWLAREALAGRPGNLPAVTGAAGPRVLGAVYRR